MTDTIPAADRLAPRRLEDLVHSAASFEHVGRMNVLIHGPRGCGKLTRAMIMLSQTYGDQVFAQRARALDVKTAELARGFDPRDGKKAILVLVSPIHYEIDIEQPNADKVIVPFLESMTKTLNVVNSRERVVLIRHADRIDQSIQTSLRRLVETRNGVLRLIITCRSLSSWIAPLRSRFYCHAIRPPSEADATAILARAATLEKWKTNTKHCLSCARVGSANTIDLSLMLMVAQASHISKKNYVPERRKTVDQLATAIQRGGLAEARPILEEVVLRMPYDAADLIAGDLIVRLLNSTPNKTAVIEAAARWQPKMASATHLLLVAEALVADVVSCL